MLACGTKEHHKEENKLPVSTAIRAVIITIDGGFGYDIFKDSTRIIHQPHIPAAPGIQAFANQEDAQKISELVIRKIKNGEMPPTVSLKELNQLNIQYKQEVGL